MKSIRFAIPAFLLCGAMLLNSSLAFAKKEYTVKEKKACTFCHVAANSKELNDAGKYYKEKKTLEGFVKTAAVK
jgi:cytochrome c551/c552